MPRRKQTSGPHYFLTQQQENEIFPLLDRAFELPTGKALIYPTTESRGDYLSRMIMGLRYHSAIESLSTYTPGDPFYGQGMYASVWAEPHPKGLVLAILPEPRDTLPWRLIRCAATKQPVRLEHTYGTANARLSRFQSKYPEMAGVWIDAGPPVYARFGAREPEETIVVDIDLNPYDDPARPTDEDKAKARQNVKHTDG